MVNMLVGLLVYFITSPDNFEDIVTDLRLSLYHRLIELNIVQKSPLKL